MHLSSLPTSRAVDFRIQMLVWCRFQKESHTAHTQPQTVSENVQVVAFADEDGHFPPCCVHRLSSYLYNLYILYIHQRRCFIGAPRAREYIRKKKKTQHYSPSSFCALWRENLFFLFLQSILFLFLTRSNDHHRNEVASWTICMSIAEIFRVPHTSLLEPDFK